MAINIKNNIEISTFDKSIDLFINKCIEEMQMRNVNIKISLNSFTPYSDNSISNGYFGETKDKIIEFAFCVGQPFKNWLPIFIHEYCHFKQWVEDKKMFEKGEKDCSIVFSWLENKEKVNKSKIDKAIIGIQDLESDCERRAFNIIKKSFRHIIHQDIYAQKANAYILFYNFVRDNKKWYDSKIKPYEHLDIFSLMPKKIIESPYDYPSKEIKSIYESKYL